jgi:hypothetical protein
LCCGRRDIIAFALKIIVPAQKKVSLKLKINQVAVFFDIAPCSPYKNPRSDPEAGGDIFLRNVGSYTDYTVLFPRR